MFCSLGFVVWGLVVFWSCSLPPPTCSVSILLTMTWAHRPHGVRTRGKKMSLKTVRARTLPRRTEEISNTDQPKVTPVIAAQANWLSLSPISSPQPAVSEPTSQPQLLAFGRRVVVVRWMIGAQVRTSVLCLWESELSQSCRKMAHVPCWDRSQFHQFHPGLARWRIGISESSYPSHWKSERPPRRHCLFVRAVFYGGCASERLFSKASKALQLMTFGNRHPLCCNFRTSLSACDRGWQG